MQTREDTITTFLQHRRDRRCTEKTIQDYPLHVRGWQTWLQQRQHTGLIADIGIDLLSRLFDVGCIMQPIKQKTSGP